MKSYIREAINEREEFRDFGAVNFEDTEIDLIKHQTEKDMGEIDPLF